MVKVYGYIIECLNIINEGQITFTSKAISEIFRDVKGLLLSLTNGNKYFLLLFVVIVVVIHILFPFAGGDWTIERALGRGEEGFVPSVYLPHSDHSE